MILYIIFLYKVKGLELTNEAIAGHVAHIRRLKAEGRLVMCGPFSDHPSGMIIIKANDKHEAVGIAEQDPFVIEGYRTFEVRTLQVANEENNFLESSGGMADRNENDPPDEDIILFLGMPMRWEARNIFKSVWNPKDDRVFPPKYFGIGWSLNFHALLSQIGVINKVGKTNNKKN